MSKHLPLTQGKTHPVLRARSKDIPVANIASEEMQTLIEDMKKTMHHERGVGLAAPQIGKNLRLFTVATKDGDKAFLNPKMLWKSIGKEIGEEGCLSLPGLWGTVKRSKSVKISYSDENGKKHTIKAKGFFARVLQHEYDHIEGGLYIDRADEYHEE